MQRVFGMLAVFGGWLCLLLAVFSGLIATQFLGLDHVEGALPPNALYGIPALMVMWVAIVVAIVAAVPVGAAMFHKDPSSRLYVVAAVMAVLGLALIPDELGRAYAAALLPGAALFAAGGWLIHEAGEINPDAVGTAAEAAETAVPAPTAPVWQLAAPNATLPLVAPPDLAPPLDELVAATRATEAAPTVAAPADGPLDLTYEIVAASPAAPEASSPDAAARVDEMAAPASMPVSAEPQSDDAECPWCSARLSVGVDRCPSCGAALSAAADLAAVPIPGVTAIAPELAAYKEKVAHHKKRQGILSMMLSEPDARLFVSSVEPADGDALRPPSAEVRAEMDRFDRELAAGSPSGQATVPETGTTDPGATPGATPGASDPGDSDPGASDPGASPESAATPAPAATPVPGTTPES